MNEFALIDEFLKAFPRVPPPQGPGDDCAVLPASREALCVTTDALVENVHFTRRTFSLEDVGHKALAVNLSDLAAMGARPAWALCALGVPRHLRAADVRALARGMARLARTHQVDLLGGNVTKASELSVTMTLGGLVPRGRRPLLRSGAKAGDALYVSGTLGEAAAGLQVLRRGAANLWPSLARAQRRPTPSVALGLALGALASACIDVSDGLVQDLAHLCQASGVGAELSSEAVPISEAHRRFDSRGALHRALTGGEDYVLLFSVPPGRRAALERTRFNLFHLGTVASRTGIRVDGRLFHGPGGFIHFR